MKFLKYLLYLIIALLVLFFALGLAKPVINYGHEITVDKSIKEAWAVHSDESKLGDWLEGFKSIELIDGKQGEVGSRYKVVVKPSENEDDFIMTETIVSKKDFEELVLNFDSEMMMFDQTTYFSESNGKTTIKKESEVTGKGIMARSMFALMNMFGSFEKQEVRHMESLKDLINKNTTDYFPSPNIIKEIQSE